MGFSTIKIEIGEVMEFFLGLFPLEDKISHRKNQTTTHEVIDLTILLSADPAFASGFTTYEQKHPQTENQMSSSTVCFTTIEERSKENSELSTLNF